MTVTPYVTEWEKRQHAADNGQLAAIAQGYANLSAYLKEHGQQDRALLGITHLPPDPTPYLLPVLDGTPEERIAAVNAFAEVHGVTAHWDAEKYTWRAVVWFGPIRYVAYAIPSEGAQDAPAPAPEPELAVA